MVGKNVITFIYDISLFDMLMYVLSYTCVCVYIYIYPKINEQQISSL